MARFRYRMQNILTVKEKLETQAKNDYARALMVIAEEEETLEKMEEHLVFLEEEARRLVQAESLNIRDIEDNKLSMELQKEAIERQKGVIQKARQDAEQKRLVMVDLMQERKTHEILKERAFEEFLQQEKADESKQIDQLTSYTYGQK